MDPLRLIEASQHTNTLNCYSYCITGQINRHTFHIHEPKDAHEWLIYSLDWIGKIQTNRD